MAAGGNGEEFLLQHRLVGNCPFPLCKVGHETVTAKVIAVLWTLLCKAAIQDRFQPLSICFLISHWDPGLKSMAILLTVSFSCGRRPGYHFIHPYPVSILTPCLSFPRIHPYHSALLRNSHSQKRGSGGRGRETPLISRSLQAGASVRAAVQRSVCY